VGNNRVCNRLAHWLRNRNIYLMKDRIVITGVGLVDTLGTYPMECFENMISDHYEHPVDFKTDIESLKGLVCFKSRDVNYTIPDGIRKPVFGSLSTASKNALHVVQQAMGDIDSTDVAVVFSSIAGKEGVRNTDFCNKMEGGKRLSPRTAVQYLRDFSAGVISQTFDFRGACVSMDAACATGLYSIDYAIHLLDTHRFVIVGGTDNPAMDDNMFIFSQLGALGTASKPFDKKRDGFVMGEGAGALLLEKESEARLRGANIIGYINTVSHHSDGALGTPTAPDPNSTGSIASMTSVTQNIVGDVAFVNAHGTSTPMGDDLEYNAIQEVLPKVPVISFKSKIGHSLAASGINETIYSLLCLYNGVIPKNFNIDECDHEFVYKYKHRLTSKIAVKNSFAFSGRSSSLVLEVE
jgi:3-oxoacyl-[acyl-carrier-protein] synthase II